MSALKSYAATPPGGAIDNFERSASEPASEAALLITCLRGLPFAVPRGLDWKVLLRLATSHGVLQLVHRSLHEMDAALPDFFVEAARIAGERAEALADHLRDLLHSFAERGIDVLPLKGPVLAQSIYGDAAARPSVDLDLLVRRSDVPRAEALLFDRGFKARRPSDYDRRFLRDGLSVELHSKIASPQYCSFDVDKIWSRSHAARFREEPIRAMSGEDLILYLCAHGLKHGFSRLIWILDLAHALSQRSERGYDELIRRARREGMVPWLLVGCEVVRMMFPQRLPVKLDELIATQAAAAQRARLTAERLFVQQHTIAIADHREFYLQAEPSAIRRWRYRLRFFSPTPSDHLWAEHHRFGSQLTAIARPFRLLRKYGPARLWQTMFPPVA